MESIPTIIATESTADEVHRMAIFGWHDSHDTGRRKYENEHECFQQANITVQLATIGSMEALSHAWLWKDSEKQGLKPYPEEWKPIHLTQGEWYSIVPKSVIEEDKKLRVLLPPSSDDVLGCMEHPAGDIPAIGEAHKSQELKRSLFNSNPSPSIISQLFYSDVSHV